MPVTSNHAAFVRPSVPVAAWALGILVIVAMISISESAAAAPAPAGSAAEEDSTEYVAPPPYKTPFTRLLELPGRALRGTGRALAGARDMAGEALDGARAIRDEIYHDGLGTYFRRRFYEAADSTLGKIDGILLGAGDISGARAARTADEPERADEFYASRQRSARIFGEGLREAGRVLDPVAAPIREATEIASDPDPFNRTKSLAAWLDLSARSLASSLASTGKDVTKKDANQRIKDQLRERIQKLPPDQQRMAYALLETVVTRTVDTTFSTATAAVNRSLSPPPPRTAPRPAAAPHVQLSGAANWDAGNGNQLCVIAGTIDVTAQRFSGKCINGIFRKVAYQTFTGEFSGQYTGNAERGSAEGSGTITIRFRNSETGRFETDAHHYGLRASFSGGIAEGSLTSVKTGQVLYRFRLPMR